MRLIACLDLEFRVISDWFTCIWPRNRLNRAFLTHHSHSYIHRSHHPAISNCKFWKYRIQIVICYLAIVAVCHQKYGVRGRRIVRRVRHRFVCAWKSINKRRAVVRLVCSAVAPLAMWAVLSSVDQVLYSPIRKLDH